jgi:hypothetical protein
MWALYLKVNVQGFTLMKYILFFLLTFSPLVFSGVGSPTTTSLKAIEIIDIQLSGGEVYYYFKPVGGNWGATGCEAAKAAYIKKSANGADALLSVALTAKATKTLVQIQGHCGNNDGVGPSVEFIYINFMTIMPS